MPEGQRGLSRQRLRGANFSYVVVIHATIPYTDVAAALGIPDKINYNLET